MRACAAAVCAFSVGLVLAQDVPTSGPSPTVPKFSDVNPDVLNLVIQDQWDRGMDMFGGREVKFPVPPTGAEIARHDEQRHVAARKLLADGALRSGKDFQFASLIFQHSGIPADLMLAHVLAVTAVEKGEKSARWLAAATLDRYLQSVQEPQVFGTQFRRVADKWSMEPYDKSLLPDATRAAFCVVPASEQDSIVDAANRSGGQVRGTGLPDCK
jgi:hypothetical protein